MNTSPQQTRTILLGEVSIVGEKAILEVQVDVDRLVADLRLSCNRRARMQGTQLLLGEAITLVRANGGFVCTLTPIEGHVPRPARSEKPFTHPLLRVAAGAVVKVLKDDGTTVQTTTTSEPWQLGHGAWVVKLEGFPAGGFDLERVWPLEKGESNG